MWPPMRPTEGGVDLQPDACIALGAFLPLDYAAAPPPRERWCGEW